MYSTYFEAIATLARNTQVGNTLADLKLENEAAENQDETDLPTDTGVIEDEAETAEEETEETNEASETSEEETESGTVEKWMETDEQTSDDDHKFTGSDIAAAKRKLKAKLGNANDEIDQLRSEVEALKTQQSPRQQPAQAPQGMPARPKREDFSFDDDQYDVAVDEWNEAKIDLKLNAHTQQAQQTQARTEQTAQQERDIDQHYTNAAKLIAEHKGAITEDDFKNADLIVRNTLNQVMPGKGDMLTDTMIARLSRSGEGSEKVMLHLGRNQSSLGTLRDKLRADPTGLDAMMYLGELRKEITAKPVKKVSQAPKPGSKLKGDESSKGQSASVRQMKATYDKGDIQTRISTKRVAKAAGHDVSTWDD